MSSTTVFDATIVDPEQLYDSVLLRNVEVTDSIHVTQIKKYFYNTSVGYTDKFRVLKEYRPSTKRQDIQNVVKTYIALNVYKNTGIPLTDFVRLTFDEIELIFNSMKEYLTDKANVLSGSELLDEIEE